MLLFGGFLLFLGYGFDRFYLGGGSTATLVVARRIVTTTSDVHAATR